MRGEPCRHLHLHPHLSPLPSRERRLPNPPPPSFPMKIAANAPTRRSRAGGNPFPEARTMKRDPFSTPRHHSREGGNPRRDGFPEAVRHAGTAQPSGGESRGYETFDNTLCKGRRAAWPRSATATIGLTAIEPSLELRSILAKGRVERETGIEPATLCLGSRCSTTELLPLTPRLVPKGPR